MSRRRYFTLAMMKAEIAKLEAEGVDLNDVPIMTPAPDHSYAHAASSCMTTAFYHPDGWSEDDHSSPDECEYGKRYPVFLVT